ncbi:MAG: J domain-containing protein [Verrucomicrobiaceae bacterium]|nr:J domain-containing protein [Verrucomicrobiaceae bacterium]
MTDCFALLGLPRSASLDESLLQAAWHEKSRAAHPDHPGGSATLAAEINAAYEALLAPEKRLKHLLDLHAVPWRTIPISAEMMSLFSQIGPLLQKASALAKKKQQASSALAKALLANEEMSLREALEALGTEIEAKREVILSALPEELELLQVAQATLAYLAKWQAQIREALLVMM